MKICIGTANKGKIKEIELFFENIPVDWAYIGEFAPLQVEETGKTFFENALLKAKAYYNHTGIPTLTDDSGLVVPKLNGRPGIYSARFAGENATDAENNALLVELMKDFPKTEDREAYYAASLIVYFGEKDFIHEEGRCYGVIKEEAAGSNGFGYDPHFYLTDYHKTMAELELKEKEKISHRGEALKKLYKRLKERINT